MKKNELPLIIEAAVSPFRPDAPVLDLETTGLDGKACVEAGASIIHHHHDTRMILEEAIVSWVKASAIMMEADADVIMYPGIMGGRTGEEHMSHLVPLSETGALGMAPVDPGAPLPYDMGDDGFPQGHGYVWNSFSTSRKVAISMMERNIPLSIGVYEPLQLRWALACEASGKLPKGSMVKLYFGGNYSIYKIGEPALNFGLPPTPQALDMYLAMMEGSSLQWNVGLFGDSLLDSTVARYALEKGGHLRVGIEDIASVTNATNVETVQAAVALAHEVGRPVATPTQARKLLAGH